VAYERGGAEAAELLARQRGLLTADNQIRVTLVLDTEDSTALVGELQRLGIVVRGTYKDLIDVGIPLELIVTTAQSEEPGQVFDQITQLEHVINMQLPSPGKPNESNPAQGGMTSATQPTNEVVGFLQPPEPITSEGVKVIGADKWQAAGYTGQGLKIGILDQGFDGYRDLLGRELPSRVSVKSFVPGIEVDQAGVSHGAAVAEVIHDVAPDAELVLAYYDGDQIEWRRPFEADTVAFADGTALRLSGWWANERLLGGGPFRLYCFAVPEQERVYLVDGSLFAPGMDKVPLMRNLDAIARTFTAPGRPSP